MSDRDDTGDERVRDPRRRREERVSDDDRAPNRREEVGGIERDNRRRDDDMLDFLTFVEERFNQLLTVNKKIQRKLRDQETMRSKPFR